MLTIQFQVNGLKRNQEQQSSSFQVSGSAVGEAETEYKNALRNIGKR